jgi:hypothetical protein
MATVSKTQIYMAKPASYKWMYKNVLNLWETSTTTKARRTQMRQPTKHGRWCASR